MKEGKQYLVLMGPGFDARQILSGEEVNIRLVFEVPTSRIPSFDGGIKVQIKSVRLIEDKMRVGFEVLPSEPHERIRIGRFEADFVVDGHMSMVAIIPEEMLAT